MRTLLALAFALCLGVSAVAQTPVPAPKTFSQTYFEEVDNANRALKTFAQTACDATNFNEVSNSTHAEYEKFLSMEKSIPDDEDDITKGHEVEVFIGYQTLLKGVLAQQGACMARHRQQEHESPVI